MASRSGEDSTNGGSDSDSGESTEEMSVYENVNADTLRNKVGIRGATIFLNRVFFYIIIIFF